MMPLILSVMTLDVCIGGIGGGGFSLQNMMPILSTKKLDEGKYVVATRTLPVKKFKRLATD